MMRFKGIMPALITPLNEDESINVKVLRELIESLLTKGAD
ncbi:MAG: dihydrodipicolinate synthase family protein, partial [Clostridia bacterium]|nr:dihydrodipicolinate synthase family protein [Clostridia bacterium]